MGSSTAGDMDNNTAGNMDNDTNYIRMDNRSGESENLPERSLVGHQQTSLHQLKPELGAQVFSRFCLSS
jgi:hypothetical protein